MVVAMPFILHPPREIRILCFGIALLAAAVWVDRRDPEPVFAPSARDYRGRAINPVDRLGSQVRRPRAGELADFGLYGGPTLPLLLSFDRLVRPHYPRVLVLWLETMLITFAVGSLVKNTANRPRPYVYHADWQPERALSRKDRAAFLSGHAANAAAGSVLFASLLEAYDRPLAPYGRWLALGVAGLTAYLRVRAGKHWPTDVLAGMALGGGVAGAIVMGHRRQIPINHAVE